MLKKSALWILGLFVTFFVCIALYLIFFIKIGPVSLDKAKSIEVTGTIDQLYEGGVKDVVVKLEHNPNIYYMNRALENGFDLSNMERDLRGKQVTLWHAKSRASSGGHIIQLHYRDSIYYSEWETPIVRKNKHLH